MLEDGPDFLDCLSQWLLKVLLGVLVVVGDFVDFGIDGLRVDLGAGEE